MPRAEANVILCLGHAADDTFRHSLGRLAELGTDFDALDVTQLAIGGLVDGRLDSAETLTLELLGKRYCLGDYDSVYVRIIEIAQTAPNLEFKNRAMAQYRVLNQALTWLKATIVNRPGGDCSNASKALHQVLLAQQFGLRIPKSIVTTSVGEAMDFVADCENGAIIKGASAFKTWVSTVDAERARESLGRIRECPSLIQERVVGSDIRVHVVGEACFAEEIIGDAVDYRRGAAHRYQPYGLTESTQQVCAAVTSHLGAIFSGIDFKLERASGDLVFLEANTMPCYQGYDRRARGAISAALRDCLVRH